MICGSDTARWLIDDPSIDRKIQLGAVIGILENGQVSTDFLQRAVLAVLILRLQIGAFCAGYERDSG
ncbi:hypothetical protein [Alloactinosynnema sp. L-07]|nr:hypothetical protein [Alloactinosynnema sp. L-07]